MQSIEFNWSERWPKLEGGAFPAHKITRRFSRWPRVAWVRDTVLALVVILTGSVAPTGLLGATRSPKQAVVPEWSRFERVLTSTVAYTNALQQADLTAVFTSPTGDRRIVNGFWDGGRVWRVRFCPDIPGQWTFSTFCSDPRNDGLDGQTGHFLCTAPVGDSVFQQHGPIQVARDHTHFEHADGTPFFWLADVAGAGATLSTPKDWQRYASIRSSQRFNVALCNVGLDEDDEQAAPVTGFSQRIGINPSFFQHLDAKLEALHDEGILSAIVPMPPGDGGLGAKALPEDQAILLMRYLLARWGTEPVAWVIDCGNGRSPDPGAHWDKICRAVFTNSLHAPVVLCNDRVGELAPGTHEKPWADALGITVSAAAATGNSDSASELPSPASTGAARPVVVFGPRENGVDPLSHKRCNPDDVRHAVYRGLLLRTPAGVTYAAQGVVNWDNSLDPNASAGPGAGMALWERSLFMPGAKQMRALANLMNSIDFWRLRPRPDAVPDHAMIAAATTAKDLTLVYLPQSNPVDVSLQAMPASPQISWLEPRQGFTRSAVAVVSGSVCQFPPPGQGDWVLLIQSGKRAF